MKATESRHNFFTRFETKFNEKFQAMLNWYEGLAMRAMERPGFTAAAIFGGVVLLLLVTVPFIGRAYFPALIQASSSSTCACQAARALK